MLTFTPAQITFSSTAGGNTPSPQSVTVTGARSGVAIQPFTASWLSAVASGQNITFSLTAAAATLTPGSYTVAVGIKDVATTVTDTFTVALNVQGALVSSVSSVALAARGGVVQDTVLITATGNGRAAHHCYRADMADMDNQQHNHSRVDCVHCQYRV